MNQRSVAFGWLATILLLAIFAGVSWVDLELTAEAGGLQIPITGYLVFPIISALVLLQAAALLASFFTPAIVGRFIALVLLPIQGWHLWMVVGSIANSFQVAISAQIADATGVVGASSQSQLVASSLDTLLWYGYILALALNILVLAVKAFRRLEPAKKRDNPGTPNDPMDLWESQK
jgi:hypothetical protein